MGGARGFSPLKEKNSFTLAEVLITLGIIGVVAAMTLPTLIQNHKKKEIVTRLEKTYSIMNQAINLSKANDTWGVIPLDKRWDAEALAEWFESALLPYLKVAKYCGTSAEGACKAASADMLTNNGRFVTLIFPDGVKLYMLNNNRIHVFVDINANRKPNKGGEDIFVFSIYNDDQYLRLRKTKSNLVGYFHPMEYASSYNANGQVVDNFATTRDDMIKFCSKEYRNGNIGNTCALLIMHDGWKIADDYPIKL